MTFPFVFFEILLLLIFEGHFPVSFVLLTSKQKTNKQTKKTKSGKLSDLPSSPVSGVLHSEWLMLLKCIRITCREIMTKRDTKETGERKGKSSKKVATFFFDRGKQWN